ncbi:DUF4153 domain-containing protein [Peptoniphilus obesi]|uniref:DUF4153 domain-containing protein n=1 Tax=Peptoniphilus obesi TaxID=1472765 RepID=UPI0004BC6BFA|nr:DUF4153 domain-containing protein [Peptoniphilus obesi]
MKIFYKALNTLNRSKSAYKRFTPSMVFVILSAIFFSYYVASNTVVEYYSSDPRQVYFKLAWLLIIATAGATFLTLFKEALKTSSKNEYELKRSKYIQVAAIIILLILIFGVYSKLFQQEDFMAYDTKYVYFGVLLFLSCACLFIGKIFNHKNFVEYFFKIVEAMFISLSFSTVLFIGLSAIYFLITKLFDIAIVDKVYIITFIIIYLPFNVGIFLSYFPRNEIDFDNYKLAKPFVILVSYITVPIFIIYAFILYIYFFKILIQAELPKGVITNLVLVFALLTVILLFISSVIKSNKLVEKFREFFQVIMIPILVMMFYAIFIRISNYGLTENRYFVIAAGIYTLISMIYYIFYRSNSNIFIFISLAAIIFLSTIGPVSAYNLSASSQDARLASILNANGMLESNQIKPKKNVSLDDKIQIKEIVEYLSNNHRSWESKYLPKNFEFNNENFEEVFGFNIEDDNLFSGDSEYNFKFDRPVDIKGYDKILKFDSFDIKQSLVGNYFVDVEDGTYTISYKNGRNEFDLTSFTGKEVFDKMIALKESKDIVDVEDLKIEGVSNNIKYKIVFTLVGYYGSKNELSNYYIEFYLLTASVD